MILVDTNAWIRHLRKSDPRLVTFLLQQRVHTCDVVVGELLLGSGLPKSFATDIQALPRLPCPAATETLAFMQRNRKHIAGAGVGWADVQIVLAAAKSGARLHSSDRGIRRICRALDVSLSW